PVSFSWSPFKETTKYKFALAKDAAMTQIVKEAEVTTTAFEYDGALDYSTNYFWRVMSLEPAPSDWSATFSFQTESLPPPEKPADEAAPTPFWVWVVIAIGAILVIVTLVLIFKTRRV
ncbi:MAG: fibronectin type III domain-containing protein, partial [Chloroflexota bacterium]